MDQPIGMRKTPVVVGLLGIILGSLMALTAVWSLASLFFTNLLFGTFSNMFKMLPKTPGMPDMAGIYDAMKQLMLDARPYFVVQWGVKAALSVALIYIGWGLYRRLGTMRRWAVWWSVAALVTQVGEALFQIGWYLPRTLALFEPYYRDMPMGAMQTRIQHTSSYIGVVVTMLFYSAWPVTLMALMGRKSAARDLI